MASNRFAPLPSLPALLLRGAAGLLRNRAGPLPGSGLAASFSLAGIEPAAVARYRAFFAYPGSHVPLAYFYLLAQRAQLALMLDERFPHSIRGLIHTANDLRRHNEPLRTSPLEIDVSLLTDPAVGAARTIAFAVELWQAGQRVLSCRSEYRLPGPGRKRPAGQAEPEKLPASFLPSHWTYEKPLIRRYAMLSGDYNPIHLSSLLARGLGFPGAIAHGMYSVGRAAASIERRTSRPVIAISADFRRPIPLPARAIFGFGQTSATQGTYGVLLPAQQRLALSGAWESEAD